MTHDSKTLKADAPSDPEAIGLTLISALAEGRLAVLDIKGLPIMRQLFVVHRADRILAPPVRALWDYIVSEGRSFLPTLRISGKISLPPS